MVMTIYKRAFQVLIKKPVKLWGVTLLGGLLSAVCSALFGIIPGVSLAISLLFSVSLTMLYLRGYRGEEVNSTHLFDAFQSWAVIKRVLCGMAWMVLWIFLWGLIPVVGPIFVIIRTYQYRLTPYILVTEPDVPVTEAIKVSTKRTSGYKGKMFLADFLAGLILGGSIFVLGLLAMIPYVGVLFGILIFLVYIAAIVLMPLFMGLVQAAFYEEITNPTIVPKIPNAHFCTSCGAPIIPGSAFCGSCGAKQ